MVLQIVLITGCMAAMAHAQIPDAPVPATPPGGSQPATPAVPLRTAPSPEPHDVHAAPPAKTRPTRVPLWQQEIARQQMLEEEHQRILGVVPNFNTSYIANAAPLTPKQKLQLAFKGALDPFEFVAAGLVAGYDQATDQFEGYGQGAQGYAKRFGASYVDSFDGAILGNAIFPILFHEDARYFRRGTGTKKRRALYALSTAFITKNDDGTWGPNYANVAGNIAAGGLSNIYYPSTDRGVALTFENAAVVTAEGDIGSLFIEFWPDISRKLFKPKKQPVDKP